MDNNTCIFIEKHFGNIIDVRKVSYVLLKITLEDNCKLVESVVKVVSSYLD